MTGPEHYREAEQALELAVEADSLELREALIAGAHVHATLALAAATAMQTTEMHDLDYMAWDRVCGVQADEATGGGDG